MDIDDSVTHPVSSSLSPSAAQFELELDTMKSVSYITLSVPVDGQGSHAALTAETKVLGDVELEGDWAVDKRNPLNWPQSKKWAAVSVVRLPCRFYRLMV
jgi:hypothetical protein